LKIITFIDSNGDIILKEKITSLPLKEECIINKSIELFNDNEPCIIHRTFIMKKIYFEIEQFFDRVLNDGNFEILVDLLPDNVIGVLDLNYHVKKVVIMHG